MRQAINHLDRRIQLERARDGAADDRDRAYVRLVHPVAERAQARQAAAQFRAALAEVYRDPMAARRAFYARAEQMGDSAAAAEMGRRPERFGKLRGRQIGPVRSAERAAARQAAPNLQHLGNEHVRRVRETWANRAEYGEARATVVRLERQIKTLDRELERGPGRAHLEQRLARQIQGLQPSQRRTLRRSVPIPHRKLLAAATMLGREFAQEQGNER